ncbi:EAL domain-containing protein [Marinicella meishanensis]|uniref:EAL domain-containing protein n=1 Tax=Marinicella meishanensis TaxID=2873263 RepID=UPI001CBAB45F|nr:EAL domain-containing protein [Marinicella sp. NBU2979]
MHRISSLLHRLNKKGSIIALQEASISMVPMILTVTFLLMVAEGLSLFTSATYVSYIRDIHSAFYLFFPLIFTIALAVAFAKSKEVDPTSLIILCVSLLTLSVSTEVSNLEQMKESTYYKIIPIPLCYLTAKVLRYFSQKPRLHLFKADFMSFHLNKTFNHILPTLFTFVAVFVLFMLFESVWHVMTHDAFFQTFKIENSEHMLGQILLQFLYKITWFFGVNPSHVFAFTQAPYFEAFAANQAAHAAGEPIPNINVPGTYFFSDIGGAGSAFCLILAVLMFSRKNRHRKVAKMSLLPSTFNISEIIHYGLPIVFNPFLFVPFICVPILLHLNTTFFMSIGVVSPVVVAVPWTTPPLLNAYLATDGDVMAVVLQVLNLTVGTLLYLKFLRMWEGTQINTSLINQFVDKFNLETREIQALQYRNQQSLIQNLATENQINKFLLQLSHGQLMLYFQPIVAAGNGQVVKVEALLRLQDEHGEVHLPTFINALSEVGLAIDIDRWVMKQAVNQSQSWPSSCQHLSISINVSPSSLLDRGFIDEIIEMQAQSSHLICIEILENQAVFEEQIINEHLKILTDQGIDVLLDDFGSGYSALSMLSKLHIKGVKYDIDFSDQLQDPLGAQVFESCLKMSKTLNHRTILEGIETAEQLALAQQSGVDYVQGFHIAKPLTEAQLIAFMADQTA